MRFIASCMFFQISIFILQKMITELEVEVLEMRAMVVRVGGNHLQKLESEKSDILTDLKELKEQLTSANVELSMEWNNAYIKIF